MIICHIEYVVALYASQYMASIDYESKYILFDICMC